MGAVCYFLGTKQPDPRCPHRVIDLIVILQALRQLDSLQLVRLLAILEEAVRLR